MAVTLDHVSNGRFHLGLDSYEIDFSVHVLYRQDADVSELADTAARHHANVVDLVLFTMGSPNDPSMVGALAEGAGPARLSPLRRRRLSFGQVGR